MFLWFMFALCPDYARVFSCVIADFPYDCLRAKPKSGGGYDMAAAIFIIPEEEEDDSD